MTCFARRPSACCGALRRAGASPPGADADCAVTGPTSVISQVLNHRAAGETFRPRGSMLRVKGQDGFLPLGPELVPASEFDPTDFTLRTYLNGDVVQETSAADLVFGVAYQLADLCRTITLEPGDVLLTGTPANSRPMKPGDVVEVEISGLGRLESTVEEWDVDLAGPGEQLQVSAQTLHVALAIPEDEAERMVAEGRVQ